MDDEVIEGRFDLMDERLDHYSDRLEKLEGDKARSHGHRLEWIVILLVGLEAAFEVLLYFHHG